MVLGLGQNGHIGFNGPGSDSAHIGVCTHVSGILKPLATKLSKIANDLRLLSSGPRGGLGEIHLRPMQPGSSLMPGKVNPVIPEMVNQVAFHVIGSDLAITLAAEAGQLQLSAFEPLIAYEPLNSPSSCAMPRRSFAPAARLHQELFEMR